MVARVLTPLAPLQALSRRVRMSPEWEAAFSIDLLTARAIVVLAADRGLDP